MNVMMEEYRVKTARCCQVGVICKREIRVSLGVGIYLPNPMRRQKGKLVAKTKEILQQQKFPEKDKGLHFIRFTVSKSPTGQWGKSINTATCDTRMIETSIIRTQHGAVKNSSSSPESVLF